MVKIDLKEVMAILRSGKWIKSLKCLTANLNTGTGGKIIEYKNVRIARQQLMQRRKNTPLTGHTGQIKDAQHNFHFTINLEMRNRQIRKIHPILIFEINNQPVL